MRIWLLLVGWGILSTAAGCRSACDELALLACEEGRQASASQCERWKDDASVASTSQQRKCSRGVLMVRQLKER
jgi:hypothetical protein